MNFFRQILAVPSMTSIQRMVANRKKIKEGEFQFDELSDHLKDFNSPRFVNIHLDDTGIIHRVEYDQVTDRFVGFCLPVKYGLPLCGAFIFHTFNEIKECAKYAHCVVAQPIDVPCPAYVLFVIGTDSTYISETISKRWNYIEDEVNKRDISVSYGTDGAGPFFKAMVDETRLFTRSLENNVPTDSSFFLMPNLKNTGLH